MSEIQRFTADANHSYKDNVFGTYVLYSDHVEALRQAREQAVAEHMALSDKVWEEMLRQAEQRGRDGVAAIATEALRQWYEQGQRDERDRIRRFIVGLTTTEHTRHFAETILWRIDKGSSDSPQYLHQN